MDDYADYLAEEARSDIVALHQFRILYETGRDAYHFFFEGEEDGLFFMPEARRHTDVRSLHLYDCGGKGNVVEVRELIKSEGYDVERCLFFIDRDFDDFLGTQVVVDEYTYITDGYSVENDVATLESARIIMTEILRISMADPEFRKIENALEVGFKNFYTEIRPLIAWILAARSLGCSPNIRNTVGLKGVVMMTGLSPRLTKDGFLEFKRKVVVNGRLPTMSSVIKWRRLLDISAAKIWVRGKYEIWFFYMALVAALEDTNSRRKAAGGRAIKIPSALRSGNIFEILGGRISPPTSLREFFRARLQKGIK